MEIDPHTLQQILVRIEKQMRCPQCGKNVPVDFSSVRVMGEDALLLQLKCDACNAFIVLHASLQGIDSLKVEVEGDDTANASSTLQMSEDEMKQLQGALTECDGSFSAMFEKYGAKEESEEPEIDIDIES